MSIFQHVWFTAQEVLSLKKYIIPLYWCQRNFETENFIKDLQELPWSVLDSYDDPDNALDMWTSMIESIVDEHLPWQEKRVKHLKESEWMNEVVIHAINTRDKFVKSKDFDKYQTWRNKVVSLIRHSKMDYNITVIDQNKTCSKQFWKYVEESDPK